eukprot:10209087-Alexandrium_andersonii.AAC.1
MTKRSETVVSPAGSRRAARARGWDPKKTRLPGRSTRAKCRPKAALAPRASKSSTTRACLLYTSPSPRD